jgi:Tol biopolymer transport system component
VESWGANTVAARARRIKRRQGRLRTARSLGALLFAVLAAGRPEGARGQAPDEAWRTLTTEHFRVTFPAELESLGRRAAARAERAYAELAERFVEPPEGPIDLLVTDHSDVTSGFAQVRPSNRITVFARPPVDGPSLLYFDDWLELVITHELAHVVHLDRTGTLVGKLLRGIFGRAETGWPYFPGMDTPAWVVEGLATWYESHLTGAGRVRGTFHEMVLRTAILEGRFEDLGEASGFSPLWPGGNRAYVYGSLFFDYLLERYGEDRLAAFAEAVAGQWIPYRIDAAGRRAFGVSLTEAWRSWEEELRSRYRDYDVELARIGPLTTPERLTMGARWAWYPQVSPDGQTLVHAQADGRSDMQLRQRPVAGGPSRAVARTNGLPTFSFLPDGRLLVSQLEHDGPYRTYADLYVMDLAGTSRRLTHGARLEQPSASPDGAWAVAVQQGGGTNALVKVDLASGAVSTLIPPDLDVHWAFPRVSPNGRWIAVTRWEPEAYMDIVVLEAGSGREVHRVTHDRAVDFAPAWSPDSRWIVWSSDRTGAMNVLASEIDPASGRAGEPLLLTNVRTGVAFPSIDPSGEWLYVSGHHADGWEAERLPFAPRAGRNAPAPDPRFAPRAESRAENEAGGEVEVYSSLPTLLPTYWLPRLREPVREGWPVEDVELLGWGVGAQTSGVDLVGRHAYGAYAQAFTRGSEWEGGLGYAYRGLGNPVFSLAVEQTWHGAGTLFAGSRPDVLYVLERERALSAAVTFASVRWRSGLALTLGGGMVWEARELLDETLVPSRSYSLARPTSRLGEARISLGYTTARSHSFQLGRTQGLAAAVQVRARRDLGLERALVDSVGVDRSFEEITGRLQGYVPLWRAGFATHVLALQLAGGAAFGPEAELGHFDVGGATGATASLAGFSLSGGSAVFLPVRGYPMGWRAGRWAWAGAAEYRFPIALLNRGFGAWPLHLDRVLGTLFFDAGNAWGPEPRDEVLAAAGAEVSLQMVGFFRYGLLLRTGVALPLVDRTGAGLYVRAGLPF